MLVGIARKLVSAGRPHRSRRVGAAVLVGLIALGASGFDAVAHALAVGAERQPTVAAASATPGVAAPAREARSHHDPTRCALCASLWIPAASHVAAQSRPGPSLVAVRTGHAAPASEPSFADRWSALVPRAPPGA